jgi:hypothetical protein
MTAKGKARRDDTSAGAAGRSIDGPEPPIEQGRTPRSKTPAKKTASVKTPLKNAIDPAQNDLDAQGATPPPAQTPQVATRPKEFFSMHITHGYSTRRLFEVCKSLCNQMNMYLSTKGVNLQAHNLKPDSFTNDLKGDGSGQSFARVTIDSYMFASNFNLSYKPKSDDETYHTTCISLSDATMATSSLRKKDGLILCNYEGEKHMRAMSTRGNTFQTLTGTSIINILADNPERLCIEDHYSFDYEPNVSISVNVFCTAINSFTTSKCSYVKMTVYPDHIDLIGYIDETRPIHENRLYSTTPSSLFTNEPRIEKIDTYAPDVPGSTFYLSKKMLAALFKIKQIPPDEMPIRIYHQNGGPVKIRFNLGLIGETFFYIINM